jgi:hypothetical protein
MPRNNSSTTTTATAPQQQQQQHHNNSSSTTTTAAAPQQQQQQQRFTGRIMSTREPARDTDAGPQTHLSLRLHGTPQSPSHAA